MYYKEADASVAKLKEQPPQELEDLLQGITMDDLYQAFRQVMARKETKEDKVLQLLPFGAEGFIYRWRKDGIHPRYADSASA